MIYPTSKEAIASRQDKEWKIALNKELDSLKQHQAFNKVSIKAALLTKKVVDSRFVFKQKTAGLYK